LSGYNDLLHKFGSFFSIQKKAVLQSRNKILIKLKVTYFLNAILLLWKVLQLKVFCYALPRCRI